MFLLQISGNPQKLLLEIGSFCLRTWECRSGPLTQKNMSVNSVNHTLTYISIDGNDLTFQLSSDIQFSEEYNHVSHEVVDNGNYPTLTPKVTINVAKDTCGTVNLNENYTFTVTVDDVDECVSIDIQIKEGGTSIHTENGHEETNESCGTTGMRPIKSKNVASA